MSIRCRTVLVGATLLPLLAWFVTRAESEPVRPLAVSEDVSVGVETPVGDQDEDGAEMTATALEASGPVDDQTIALVDDEQHPPLPDNADPDWWTTVTRRLQNGEYQLRDLGEGRFRFTNRAQGLRGIADGGGMHLMARSADADSPDWSLDVQTLAIGRGEASSVQAGPARVGGCSDDREDEKGACLKRLEQDVGDGVVAWWANTTEGLQQGWTFQEDPGGHGPLVIEVGLQGFEAEASDDGLVLSRGAIGMHVGRIAAWDAMGRDLTAHVEPTDEGYRLDVDVDGAVWPVVVDPVFGVPQWSAESSQNSSYFGHSVANAGDVNNDGFDDIIVGAWRYWGGESKEGAAYVFHGSASGLSASSDWSFESDQIEAFFGHAVSGAGDVNNDGYDDVIIGASGYDGSLTDEGRAYIFHGSAQGLKSTVSRILEGNQADARFGVSVSGAGDVDGDGYDDVVVGATGYDNGETDEGRAFVFLGGTSGISSTSSWTGESDQDSAYYGLPVAGAGDVDGDGYDDIIVGAAYYDENEINDGKAYVYLGGSGGLALTPTWTATGDDGGQYYGRKVSSAGDVNDDGYDDIVVKGSDLQVVVYHGGSSGPSEVEDWSTELCCEISSAGDVNDDGYADLVIGFYRGAVVYLGSSEGLSEEYSVRMDSHDPKDEFGDSVAGGGDVNGDGFADIIVGAPSYVTETEWHGLIDGGIKGQVHVFHGNIDGMDGIASFTNETGLQASSFGSSARGAGDVNGDGYDDVVVGAHQFDGGQYSEGKVFLFEGTPWGLADLSSWSIESDESSANLGYSVSSAGDVNADGYDDIIAGAYRASDGEDNEGLAYVFHGSSLGLSDEADWTHGPDQSSAHFGYSVSAAGDVNDDGYADVVVGAPLYDGQLTDAGRAYVFHGSSTGLTDVADWMEESDDASSRYGQSVSLAGDVNGDGYDDVIVGAQLYDTRNKVSYGGSNGGKVYLYEGGASGLASTAGWSFLGRAGDSAGFVVATADDVNGDGFSDVMFRVDDGVRLYEGSATGLGTFHDWYASDSTEQYNFGWNAASAGDVNGDGYADVLVAGSRGGNESGLYLGLSSGVHTAAEWQVPTWWDDVGDLAGIGDVNRDGYDDFILAGNDGGIVYYGSGDGPELVPNQPADVEPIVVPALAEGDSVSLTASASDPEGTTVTYAWDMGDGTTYDTASITHTYADSGTHVAIVTVTDADGIFIDVPVDIVVDNLDPTLSFTIPSTGTEGESSAFTASGEDIAADPLTFAWDFGDGTTATGDAPSHTWTDDGSYTVTVTVSDDDGGSATNSAVVLVANVDPTVSADIPATGSEGVLTTFTATGSDVPGDELTYTWDFGDGQTATGAVVTHSFLDDGAYAVQVDVSDGDGGQASASSSVEVANVAPVMAATPVLASAQENANLSFSAETIDVDADTVTVGWDMGDGTVLAGETVVHLYDDDGDYIVTVTLTDEDGGESVSTYTQTVDNVAPVIAALDDLDSEEEGRSFTVTPSVTDAAGDTIGLSWDMGDDTILTGATISHTYADDGDYTVVLTASDEDGGSATDTFLVTAANVEPAVTGTPDATGSEAEVYTFAPEADDPGDEVFAWHLDEAPEGAEVDTESGDVTWTPSYDDARLSPVSFTLTVDDGDGGEGSLSWNVEVGLLDEDGDGMSDVWEEEHGLDPTVDDAAADDDMDGRTQLDEFTLGTDPSVYEGPGQVVLVTPEDAGEASVLTPLYTWQAAPHPLGDPLTYQVQVFTDETLLIELTSVDGLDALEWTQDVDGVENTDQWWRARASDGFTSGSWSQTREVFLNGTPESPATPTPLFPVTGQHVSQAPVPIQFTAVEDPDRDPVTYRIQLRSAYNDAIVESVHGWSGESSADVTWPADAAFKEDSHYTWRARAEDEDGSSEWTESQEFVFSTVDGAPGQPFWLSPEDDEGFLPTTVDLVVQESVDDEGDLITHRFELDTINTFDSPDLQIMDVVGDGSGEVVAQATLQDRTDWFARVQALDTTGQVSPYASLSFRVGGPDLPPDAPTLLDPVDVHVAWAEVITFSFDGPEDPDEDQVTWELVVAVDADLTDILASGEVSGSGELSYTLDPVPFRKGSYHWGVRGTDSTGKTGPWATSVVFHATQNGLEGCACSSTGGSGRSGAWWLGFVGLMAARRRRRAA